MCKEGAGWEYGDVYAKWNFTYNPNPLLYARSKNQGKIYWFMLYSKIQHHLIFSTESKNKMLTWARSDLSRLLLATNHFAEIIKARGNIPFTRVWFNNTFLNWSVDIRYISFRCTTAIPWRFYTLHKAHHV